MSTAAWLLRLIGCILLAMCAAHVITLLSHDRLSEPLCYGVLFALLFVGLELRDRQRARRLLTPTSRPGA